MAKPAHSSLLQDGVHACAAGALQEGRVGDLVLPRDIEDASQAAHVKGI